MPTHSILRKRAMIEKTGLVDTVARLAPLENGLSNLEEVALAAGFKEAVFRDHKQKGLAKLLARIHG